MKQQKSLKKIMMKASVGVAALAISSQLHALTDTVDYVDVTSGDGIYVNEGTIVVTPVNGVYSQVSSGNTVSYHKRLKAGCKGSKLLSNTAVYYGTVNVYGGILESNDNYKEAVPHLHAGSIPYTTVELNVPLNKLGFDPVQACQDMLETKMSQGLTKMQVMNSDQLLNRNASFTGMAACGLPGGDNKYFERDVIGGSVKVICKAGASGPVNQIEKPKLNIVAVPLGGSGDFQAGHQPLDITMAQITTNKLHDSGVCPANLQFGVGFKGNGKGHIRYTITKGGFSVYKSPVISYEGAEGWKQHHFNYQMQLDANKPWEVVGKEVKRMFGLLIEIKDEKADSFDWSPHGHYTGLDWFYTCQPKLNVQMGGQQGINYDAQPNPQPIGPSKILPAMPKPQPPVNPGLQIQPVAPKPQPPVNPGKIQAQPVGPTPLPPLNIQAQPIEPEKPARASN